MSESTNADDTDLLAWATAVLLQRRVECETAAEHRRCVLGSNGVGYLDDEVGGCSAVIRISTIRLAAVGVLAIVGGDHALAMVLQAAGTLFAVGFHA